MEEYLQKKNELEELVKQKVSETVKELIQNNRGKRTSELRSKTLQYIRGEEIPGEIARGVKVGIDEFINKLEIPVQKR